jgi:hypothetical protein
MVLCLSGFASVTPWQAGRTRLEMAWGMGKPKAAGDFDFQGSAGFFAIRF